MIKQTVSYTDYNGDPQVDVLWFHVTKAELMDNLDLKAKFDAIHRQLGFDDPETEVRQMKEDEVMELLQLIKRLVRLSYGQRSRDGKNFYKGDDVWKEFESSAAYDAMLFALFEQPEKAFAFLSGIMPKDLMEQAQAQAELDKTPGRPVPQDRLQKAAPAPKAPETTTETVEGDVEVVEETEADRLRRQLAELEAAAQG